MYFETCQIQELVKCKDVNYTDPNLNIQLPIFSIHGNHDDPSGLGGFSCLDSLHSTGLINYFGRINNLEEVRSMNDNEIYTGYHL